MIRFAKILYTFQNAQDIEFQKKEKLHSNKDLLHTG